MWFGVLFKFYFIYKQGIGFGYKQVLVQIGLRDVNCSIEISCSKTSHHALCGWLITLVRLYQRLWGCHTNKIWWGHALCEKPSFDGHYMKLSLKFSTYQRSVFLICITNPVTYFSFSTMKDNKISYSIEKVFSNTTWMQFCIHWNGVIGLIMLAKQI